MQQLSTQKAHIQGLGDGGSGGSSGSFASSGTHHSTSSSPTTKARSRRRGKNPRPDLVYDDDYDDNNENDNDDDDDCGGGGGGGDNVELGIFSSGDSRSSRTVDLPWCSDPLRVKVPLGDKEERRARREGGDKPLGHTNGGSAARVDSRRASRNSSNEG